ncbi:MAG TPA: zinc ribbon domain-containing protein [Pirellulales bacterium]|nr:zinc ribbon domain-containing protein [Pirellulales bacterium]
MSDLLLKCTVCGAVLDEEDLFCPNCGAEAPTSATPPTPDQNSPTVPVGNSAAPPTTDAAPATHLTTCNFTCRSCGASMSYDASAQTLRCPFCGSEQLEKKPDAKEISPDAVVPFAVSRDQAVAGMRQWLGQGFWRPGDLAQQAAVVGMRQVYIPYWVFDAQTHTYWTADSSHTPPGARASWYPVCGQHEGNYSGLLVGASGALTGAETAALCPFDLSSAVPPDKVDLQNVIFERFTVPRKYARPLARQGLESGESDACGQYVAGKCRNMRVNVRITNLASRPMLLPVWMMAYRYRDQVFRFLCNGQTGKSSGQAPVSYKKIGVAVAIAAIILALILFWLLAAGRHHAARWDRFSFTPAASIQAMWSIQPITPLNLL